MGTTRKLWKEKLPVCKTIKDKDGNTIEILGDNENTPFFKGNQCLVNGKVMLVSRHRIGNMEMSIVKGRMSRFKVLK